MTATLEPGPDGAAARPAGDARRLVDLVFRVRELGLVVALAILVAVTASQESRFVSSQELKFILLDTSIFALLAVGQTIVVVSRNVDLSVGSVLGLSAFVSADMFSRVHGIPIVVVFLVGLGVGLACGVVNGAICAIGRVPSLVVTLATLYIIRGIDILIVGGGQVVASSVPNSFLLIPVKSIGGVPYLAIAVVAVAVAVAYWMRSFRSGRELYAIGSNPDAARLTGVPIARRVFTAFALSGAIAGVAGVLYASRFGTIDSTAGTGYELQVIAAVVVGGVAIFGGSGNAIGAALGALLLNTIIAALFVLGVSPFWDQAIAGALLLAAIALDRAIAVQLSAALRRRRSRLGA
jgi:rhamnose transport system permease protein